MKSSELRQKFLDFFEEKGHKIIPSASLIPENDPTVLFTTAGMHPLVPFLLGEKHPLGKRLVNYQKCIRTKDIDNVGDDTHLTFFEMLGNWSLGDYWKEEAIKWSFEFLTKELNIPLERLAVSCFVGDDDAPKDKESAQIWQDLGIKKERIVFLPKEDNWWGPAGEIGPCGPDIEMFYWKLNDVPAPEIFNAKDKNWVEIWNDVFMQYVKDKDGNYNTAKQKNVDTGMGMERTLAVLNGKENVYETDLFLPIIKEIEKLSGIKYLSESKKHAIAEFLHSPDNCNANEKLFRIITDHTKASVFLASEGILPSNVGHGYVLRRLLRRVVRYGKLLKMPDDFITPLVRAVVEIYKDVYPELVKKQDDVISIVRQEEEKFEKTLEVGLRRFNLMLQELGIFLNFLKNPENYTGDMWPTKAVINEVFMENWLDKDYFRKLFCYYREEKEVELVSEAKKIWKSGVLLNSNFVFMLFETCGFPLEITKELAKDNNLTIDEKEFEKLFKKHQELSRTASAGMFKGGLADNSEITAKYHTATHLLLAGLRKILGDNVFQKGSNINSERLRFDFSHKEKITKEQLDEVENFINDIIKKDLPVSFEEMSLEEAKELGAMGVFESKYGERIKVYTVGSGDNIVSREICGGPHVDRTGILGHFKIQKEESSSSGVRRIKAILE